MTNIVTICGSLRKGSANLAIARALPELAPEGMTFTLLEGLGQFPLYDADLQVQGMPQIVLDWTDAIRAADGVVIVSPEYNYSVPGVLKNALDWISRVKPGAFAGKPVALQSASSGMLGGARGQYHLRQVLVFLDARTLNEPEIFVAGATGKVSADGRLIDETSRKFIAQQLLAFGELIRSR